MEGDITNRDNFNKNKHPVKSLIKRRAGVKEVTGCPEDERRVADYPEEHTDHSRRGSGSFIVIHIGKKMKVGEEFKR